VPPERFDDVGYRIIEEPEPPRPPRRRGRSRAAVSAVLLAGAIATSAAALATADDASPPPAKATPSYDAGSQFRHDGGRHGCHHGDRSGGGADQGSAFRY
jgi:Spy/CpxP family protein refolding chaperone